MTLCNLDIVVMPMHRGSSERKKSELGLFVAVRVMIEGYVQTHDKGACARRQPKGQDHGGKNPMSRAAHGGQYCRSRLMGQCNKCVRGCRFLESGPSRLEQVPGQELDPKLVEALGRPLAIRGTDKALGVGGFRESHRTESLQLARRGVERGRVAGQCPSG